MKEEYAKKISRAKKNKKRLNRIAASLQKKRKGKVDRIIHHLHEKAFENIDCLVCANCCKTTGPLLNKKDIKRISGQLNLTEPELIARYLKVDEDNDYVFQSMPCPFLGDDNYCLIYEFRPKACREYPHTDRTNQPGILKLTVKNASICPAVAEIFEQLNN